MNDVATFSQLHLWNAFLLLSRVSAVIFFAPAFGEMVVPVRIKLGLAIAFTILLLPTIQTVAMPTHLGSFVNLLGIEVINGLFWGVILRLSIFSLEIAGSIASQTTSLSQLFSGAGGEPQPVFSTILVYAGLGLVCLMGLPVRFLEYLIVGYDIAPIGSLISPSAIGRVGLSAVSKSFSLAFVIAAPFVISSLIYNVALGLINKAMPQLMVSFVGAPAITAGSILLLMLSAPIMLDIWSVDFFQLLSGSSW